LLVVAAGVSKDQQRVTASGPAGGITIRLLRVRKPGKQAFWYALAVPFMTRAAELCSRIRSLIGHLSKVVSKNLTNSFLTFGLRTEAVFRRCRNRPDTRAFLSIPHAIG
jgi:hypothetical protein